MQKDGIHVVFFLCEDLEKQSRRHQAVRRHVRGKKQRNRVHIDIRSRQKNL
jgi:hypothetical protein